MLRMRLALFDYIHLCQRLDERLEEVWDIQGSKHAKSVHPAIQHSSLSKYLALPARGRLHFVGYWIAGQVWEEEGSAVI